MLCLVASRIWRFSSLLNKQPLRSLQLNPSTAILTVHEETFRKGFPKSTESCQSWRGRERGDMLVVVWKPLAHLWLQDEKGNGGGFGQPVL